MARHKVFISYHHKNDQYYKEQLLSINDMYDIFVDKSVNTGDIDDALSDESIRTKIRDEYLKDSTVTILLVGSETKNRKHIDWEIFSSMINGAVNKQSGIIVINLPDSDSVGITAAHGEDEKSTVYPDIVSWKRNTRTELEVNNPNMPIRIIDNLVKEDAYISVMDWKRVSDDPEKLRKAIDLTYEHRARCSYDMHRSMRRKNS